MKQNIYISVSIAVGTFFLYRSGSSLRFDLHLRTLIIVIVLFSTDHRVFAKCTYSVVLLKVSVSTSTSTSTPASVSGMHLQPRPRPVGCTFLSFIQSAAALIAYHSYLYTHSILYRPNNIFSSLQLIGPLYNNQQSTEDCYRCQY